MSRGQSFTGRLDDATAAILPDDRVLHLLLLRHGEVLNFSERIVRGQLDVDISEAGRSQHARLAAWIAGCLPRPERVLTSDLRRCHALAQTVAATTGAPLSLDVRLREQHMGDWEGRSWRELTERDPQGVSAWWDGYARARAPGGETLEELARRSAPVWDELLASGAGRVVVVTHIGVIRAWLCRALGCPLEEALRFAPAAASATSITLAAAGAVVEALGERPWLSAPAGAAPPPRRGRGLRVALSGSAGTGKTTLGRKLAAELGLPFIEEGMRTRLERGLQLHRLGHDALRRLIEELYAEQLAQEDAAPDGFVADRSSADYAAFWIHYGMIHDSAQTELWMNRCLEHLVRYDSIVLLPWGVLPLRADGVRSTNRWAQFQFQATVESLLVAHVPPGRLHRVGPGEDFHQRLAAVRAALPLDRIEGGPGPVQNIDNF